jgi:hypothetical protein
LENLPAHHTTLVALELAGLLLVVRPIHAIPADNSTFTFGSARALAATVLAA